MDYPKITTIIPTYNSSYTLETAIKSFVSQTYKNKELIIIDGDSQDDTINIIKKHKKDITYWKSEKDKGIFDAWNKGIVASSGEWIHFLGSDDYYYSEKVFEHFCNILKHNNITSKIVYGDVYIINGKGELLKKDSKPWNRHKFRVQSECIPHQGVFHHKSLFQEYGYFDSSRRFTTYEFLLRYLSKNDADYIENFIVANMSNLGESSDPKFRVSFLREYRRARKIHGTNKFDLYNLLRYFNGYLMFTICLLLPNLYARRVIDMLRMLKGSKPLFSK